MSDFHINQVSRHLHYKDKSYRMNPYDSVETSIGDFIGKIVAEAVREQEQRIKELEQQVETERYQHYLTCESEGLQWYGDIPEEAQDE